MPAQSATGTLLTQLIDALPDSVLYLEAIRNEEQELVDLRFSYSNEKGREVMKAVFGTEPGERLLGQQTENREAVAPVFEQYAAVLHTGESQSFDLLSARLGKLVNVTRSRLADGILVVVQDREVVPPEETAPVTLGLTDLLGGILEASLSGIITYQSVRDHDRSIADFTFVRFNSAARRMLNLSDEVVGKPMLDELPGVKEAGLFDRFIRVVETGMPDRFETPFPGGDGELLWYEMSVVKLGDGFVITFNDITRGKRAALENERQRSLLNGILNSSNSGVLALEAVRDGEGKIVDFRYVTVNKAAERILNQPAEKLRGNLLNTLYPGNVQIGLFSLYVHTTETGEPGHQEVHYNVDGLDSWFDISTQKFGDGFVLTFTDITAIRRANSLVERQAAELQTIVDTSQTGIFLLSPVKAPDTGEVIDFRFRLVNQMMAQFVGMTPEVLKGSRLREKFPIADEPFQVFRLVYQTGEPRRFAYEFEGDGVIVWLDIMATRMEEEILVTFVDFTPIRKLQQQLESSVTDLQRSNKNLEQFAYVASHDLQEPLRKIISFGSILESQYGSKIGEGGTDIIRRMQSAASRMQRLVRDVLAYSRITTIQDSRSTVDLNGVIHEVLENLEAALEEKQALVQREPMPTVRGDASQLRQLFQNLLGNALKFTKAGRRPELRLTSRKVRGRDSGMTLPSAEASRYFHLIEVSDNGIGFEPGQSDRIFEVFQRLHGRSTYQGTGIGLAIVKKVIENHGGYITAEGRPDEGATFRILLPES
ncbi:ATP-binding protein [Tellurirhabdus rosea]|uniref:ATP-binding protein n=1 Tax=Tellurirhabdus rosea TaxID=2674997 RepID=UPI002258B0DA|nr:ATP-binding protein [Tellurirhabdus rosea]